MAENNDFNYIFKFTWIIEYISLDPWEDFLIDSPKYTVQNMDGSQWFIQLRPGMLNGKIFGYLYRFASDSVVESIEVDFKIEMEDSKNNILFSGNKRYNFKKDDFSIFHTSVSLEDIFNNKSSIKDSLTIRCFMTSEAYKNAKSAECFARTKFSYDRICFKWTLCGLESRTFSTYKYIYYFKQYPMFKMKIETKASEDDIKIFIYKLYNFEDFGALICQFTVLNTSEANEISKRGINWTRRRYQWEFPMFLKKSVLKSKKLIGLNGNFELLCDIYTLRRHPLSEIIYSKMDDLKPDQHIFKDEEQLNSDSGQRVSNDVEQMNNGDCSAEKYHTRALIEDFSAMLNNNTETDVILKIGEEEFPAHKFVLSARSPVFKVMFEQDMSEKKFGLVQIQDLDSETLKAFLEYLYTGATMNNNAEIGHKLLLAAEKYQVESLKKLCVDLLIPALNVKNVCECLLTANMVSEQTLKAAAINFIKYHVAEVVSSPEWLNCAERNVALSVEVMRIVHSLPKQT